MSCLLALLLHPDTKTPTHKDRYDICRHEVYVDVSSLCFTGPSLIIPASPGAKNVFSKMHPDFIFGTHGHPLNGFNFPIR